MRIAVISDTHGNLTALDAVLADLRQQKPGCDLSRRRPGLCRYSPSEVIDCMAKAARRNCFFATCFARTLSHWRRTLAFATGLADDIVSASLASFSGAVHELIRTQPVAALPIIRAD